MEKIVLSHILKSRNRIEYTFSVTEGLAQFFSGEPFVIEYPEKIEAVPDAVAAVPFVCSVLPIIWLTDSVLELSELDEAFYKCIPEVRKGFETMYPESEFKGTVLSKAIVPCSRPATGKSAVFFSGGLDAVSTLVTHIEEKPALISIWGADIQFNNSDGWEKTHTAIEKYAQRFDLPDVAIHTSFRLFDRERALDERFAKQLQTHWWYGIKHGMGLLGHAAPYAYLHHISNVYIASSNCPADGPDRCASDPKTDNFVRFANARVIHDGFFFNRQDKTHNIVSYVEKSGTTLPLHVCWESQSGRNCCHCEKCYRTMMELIAEGADPEDYGFMDARKTMPNMRNFMLNGNLLPSYAKAYWIPASQRMKENKSKIKRLPYWKSVRWMLHSDFDHIETLKFTLNYRVRERLSHYKFYQFLHHIKKRQ